MSDRLDKLDYYTLFRIEDRATADEIRAAYHDFALRYHPDRYAGAPDDKKARAAQIFRRGAEGYRVLMNPDMRRRYDKGLSKGELRLSAEEEQHSRRPRPTGGLSVRSAKARPFAQKALRDVKRGDFKSAKFQLKMALQHEPENPLLLAQLADVEQQLAPRKEGFVSRRASLERETKETSIAVTVDLDGVGVYDVQTPIGFLTHMVEQLARHGSLDLTVRASGDTHIDGHHLTEDLAITLGQALAQALGDKAGIRRYGSATLPMDEACVTVALDLSGRTFFVWRVPMPKAKIGQFDTELAEVFFEGLARGAQMNLHVHKHAGDNLHHIIEVCFKALARSLREAVEHDPRARGVPSTKGTLTK